MRLSYFLLVIFVLSFTDVKAQQTQGNYVITRQGDTIKCEFSGKFWGRIKYRRDKQDSYHKIDTATIKEYYSQKDEATYRALILPNTGKPAFVKLIEDGKINLYELLIISNRSSTKYWYACKDNKPAVEVDNTKLFHSNQNFKQNISNLLADNSNAVQEYKQQMSYNFKTIKYLVHYYNSER
jgi:hypothetical protein